MKRHQEVYRRTKLPYTALWCTNGLVLQCASYQSSVAFSLSRSMNLSLIITQTAKSRRREESWSEAVRIMSKNLRRKCRKAGLRCWHDQSSFSWSSTVLDMQAYTPSILTWANSSKSVSSFLMCKLAQSRRCRTPSQASQCRFSEASRPTWVSPTLKS